MNYLLITSQRLHHGEGSRTFSDAEIDHWDEVYLANPWLYRLGISFGEFIEQPAAYLHAVGCAALMPLSEGAKFYPLLPAQRAVQERLDAEAAGQMRLPLDSSPSLAAAPLCEAGKTTPALRAAPPRRGGEIETGAV